MLGKPELPAWMDYEKTREIARYRALGYTQNEIAKQVGLSQQSVSRYLAALRDSASSSGNLDMFLLGLILGGIGAALLMKFLSSSEASG